LLFEASIVRNSKTYRLVPLATSVNFRWKIPLNSKYPMQAILNWCTAQCSKEAENEPPTLDRKREAVREKLSKFLEFIKWENMSGEEFVELASSDVLSLEQYRTFSMRIFRANFKGRRPMTREMSNPLRVYRKAIPCPSVKGNASGFFMRSSSGGGGSGSGGGAGGMASLADMYDVSADSSPSPRAFHTFRFPHITVEVETTPQCVQFKHELEPQSQLCLNFKTMLVLSGSANNNAGSNSNSNSLTGYTNNSLMGRPAGGRIQVFASVILENQVERNKSVFKRMRIADTNSLVGGGCGVEPMGAPSAVRFPGYTPAAASGKKFKSGHHAPLLQEGGGSIYGNYSTLPGNFFQGGGHVYNQIGSAGRRTTPPIRQNMFLIPVSR
jgi:hypothetical protein